MIISDIKRELLNHKLIDQSFILGLQLIFAEESLLKKLLELFDTIAVFSLEILACIVDKSLPCCSLIAFSILLSELQVF